MKIILESILIKSNNSFSLYFLLKIENISSCYNEFSKFQKFKLI